MRRDGTPLSVPQHRRRPRRWRHRTTGGDFAITCLIADPPTHPRDLTLDKNGVEWLVEAKVLYRGNATDAVRAAIGQLFTYRHLLYKQEARPRLLALFNAPIGGAYEDLLESLDIAATWPCGNDWCGTTSARSSGLADSG